MTGRARSASRPGWALSPVVAAAVVVGTLCLVAAFLIARVELALIAAPLLLTAALGWERRPRSQDASIELLATVTIDGAPTDGRASVEVSVTASDRPDALQLRLSPQDGPPVDAVVTPSSAAALSMAVAVAHSGPQRVLAVAARVLGADAAWASAPGEETAVDQVLRPRRQPVRSLPLPARLLGLTGPHLSSRPGDGGEFRDIDLFHPGDRLRRIDWRATARAGRQEDLYVRRTTATSDAAVQLVIDARDDVTGAVADWPRAHPRPSVSSLDLAREAATSLAVAYAAAGDRVGFDDTTDTSRVLPPRAGARHRERVLRAIELTHPTGTAADRVRPPRLASGALVFLLSTFLDDQPLTLALGWRSAGHRVIAVDVLPRRDASGLAPREVLALRTIELERRLRLQQLASSGAELLAWQDAAVRQERLRRLAAPRRRR